MTSFAKKNIMFYCVFVFNFFYVLIDFIYGVRKCNYTLKDVLYFMYPINHRESPFAWILGHVFQGVKA